MEVARHPIKEHLPFIFKEGFEEKTDPIYVLAGQLLTKSEYSGVSETILELSDTERKKLNSFLSRMLTSKRHLWGRDADTSRELLVAELLCNLSGKALIALKETCFGLLPNDRNIETIYGKIFTHLKEYWRSYTPSDVDVLLWQLSMPTRGRIEHAHIIKLVESIQTEASTPTAPWPLDKTLSLFKRIYQDVDKDPTQAAVMTLCDNGLQVARENNTLHQHDQLLATTVTPDTALTILTELNNTNELISGFGKTLAEIASIMNPENAGVWVCIKTRTGSGEDVNDLAEAIRIVNPQTKDVLRFLKSHLVNGSPRALFSQCFTRIVKEDAHHNRFHWNTPIQQVLQFISEKAPSDHISAFEQCLIVCQEKGYEKEVAALLQQMSPSHKSLELEKEAEWIHEKKGLSGLEKFVRFSAQKEQEGILDDLREIQAVEKLMLAIDVLRAMHRNDTQNEQEMTALLKLPQSVLFFATRMAHTLQSEKTTDLQKERVHSILTRLFHTNTSNVAGHYPFGKTGHPISLLLSSQGGFRTMHTPDAETARAWRQAEEVLPVAPILHTVGLDDTTPRDTPVQIRSRFCGYSRAQMYILTRAFPEFSILLDKIESEHIWTHTRRIGHSDLHTGNRTIEFIDKKELTAHIRAQVPNFPQHPSIDDFYRHPKAINTYIPKTAEDIAWELATYVKNPDRYVPIIRIIDWDDAHPNHDIPPVPKGR